MMRNICFTLNIVSVKLGQMPFGVLRAKIVRNIFFALNVVLVTCASDNDLDELAEVQKFDYLSQL